jgi:hypothetical protein
MQEISVIDIMRMYETRTYVCNSTITFSVVVPYEPAPVQRFENDVEYRSQRIALVR